MQRPGLQVLYEDNHLLAVNKPAGLPTMGVPSEKPSLVKMAKRYLKVRYHKPGNVFLGVMSRLDAPVTGVVLFARTSKAAKRLTDQFRNHAVSKLYSALVEGVVYPAQGEWLDWIVRDQAGRPSISANPNAPGVKQARLIYRCRKTSEGISLVDVEPQTGRKHQIRIQFATRGYPILGDRKYGSHRGFPSGIALHARRLVVAHPVQGEPLELEAALPKTWHGFAVDGY
jgi:23S rRNA pseudouridine1911/1915/1917 synthase